MDTGRQSHHIQHFSNLRRVESLLWLSTQLDTLQQAVDGADALPSEEARSGFDEARSRMPAVFSAWESVRGEALDALNAELGAIDALAVAP